MTGTDPMTVLGYVRRSTDEQGATLGAQRAVLEQWATGAGVHLSVVEETASGGLEPEQRPRLAAALDELAAGRADGLAVATGDRLARTHAIHRLDYYAARQGWQLFVLDALDRDATPETRLLHAIRVSVAEFERALIGQRTRVALAYKRAGGVRLGRPRSCPDATLARVLELRAGGASMRAVAAAMNTDRVPTPAGSPRWYPSHVSRLLATQDARELSRGDRA